MRRRRIRRSQHQQVVALPDVAHAITVTAVVADRGDPTLGVRGYDTRGVRIYRVVVGETIAAHELDGVGRVARIGRGRRSSGRGQPVRQEDELVVGTTSHDRRGAGRNDDRCTGVRLPNGRRHEDHVILADPRVDQPAPAAGQDDVVVSSGDDVGLALHSTDHIAIRLPIDDIGGHTTIILIPGDHTCSVIVFLCEIRENRFSLFRCVDYSKNIFSFVDIDRRCSAAIARNRGHRSVKLTHHWIGGESSRGSFLGLLTEQDNGRRCMLAKESRSLACICKHDNRIKCRSWRHQLRLLDDRKIVQLSMIIKTIRSFDGRVKLSEIIHGVEGKLSIRGDTDRHLVSSEIVAIVNIFVRKMGCSKESAATKNYSTARFCSIRVCNSIRTVYISSHFDRVRRDSHLSSPIGNNELDRNRDYRYVASDDCRFQSRHKHFFLLCAAP